LSASDAAALARRLHGLDAEMDAVRRRMYAVRTGLKRVAEPERELATLESRSVDLGAEFVETYRLWQAAERGLAAG
jgi:hypothetical protein